MSQPPQNQDFAPLPQYDQKLTKNESWINLTLTRSDSDGNKSQVLIIVPKIK